MISHQVVRYAHLPPVASAVLDWLGSESLLIHLKVSYRLLFLPIHIDMNARKSYLEFYVHVVRIFIFQTKA